MYVINKIHEKKDNNNIWKKLKERREKNLNINTFKTIRIYNKSYIKYCIKNF